MIRLHRWPGLVLGLLLVVETTSGAILLYHQEYFRATNGSFYAHTTSANPVTAPEAVDLVTTAHPDFDAAWVSYDHGIIAVGDTTYAKVFSVDPGSGAVRGPVNPDGGWMGLLENLHDCGLTCESSPGYVPWLADPVWEGGPSWLTGITWGGAVLGVLGVLMILLFVTGITIWWPALRKLGQRFYVVRRGSGPSGRFARDYDLHNVVAAWAMPFILLWGVTGAAFEFPGIEDAWIVATGGDKPDPDVYSFQAGPHASDARQITFAQATSAAVTAVPGEVRYVELAGKDTPYYAINVRTDWGNYAYRNFYSGDTYVYVDAYDAAHTKTVPEDGAPRANEFYDSVLEPTHFGWNVNGWWRLIWLALGLAPLALMVTGVSTWLFRRGVKKRRQAALASGPQRPSDS